MSKGDYAPDKGAVLKAAQGYWDLIFQHLAPELVPYQMKPGKAGPCPVHGGKDGFRIMKKTAGTTSGGWCQTCGPKADGLALIQWLNRWSFHQTLQEVGAVLGVKDPYGRCGRGGVVVTLPTRSKPVETKGPSNEWLRKSMRALWQGTVALTDPTAEPARLYLRSRGITSWSRPELSRFVRFHPAIPYRDAKGVVSKHPGILTTLIDPNGQAVVINRHYLTPLGEKAAVEEPKKMFPVPTDRTLPGSCVPTSQPGRVLDVSEGLETALSVETAMAVPCWPLVNAYLMANWEPPACVEAVRIWADKDAKGAGQAAALSLKRRLWERGIKAQILLPGIPIPEGAKTVDWNDVLRAYGPLGFHNREIYRDQRQIS